MVCGFQQKARDSNKRKIKGEKKKGREGRRIRKELCCVEDGYLLTASFLILFCVAVSCVAFLNI